MARKQLRLRRRLQGWFTHIFAQSSIQFLSFKQSKHGTFVNEKRISNKQKLEAGDLIGIGMNPFPLRKYADNQYIFKLHTNKSKETKTIFEDEMFIMPDNINIENILKRLEEDALQSDEEYMNSCDKFSRCLKSSTFSKEILREGAIAAPTSQEVQDLKLIQASPQDRLDYQILSRLSQISAKETSQDVPRNENLKLYDELDVNNCKKYECTCSVKLSRLRTVPKLYGTITVSNNKSKSFKRKLHDCSNPSSRKKLKTADEKPSKVSKAKSKKTTGRNPSKAALQSSKVKEKSSKDKTNKPPRTNCLTSAKHSYIKPTKRLPKPKAKTLGSANKKLSLKQSPKNSPKIVSNEPTMPIKSILLKPERGVTAAKRLQFHDQIYIKYIDQEEPVI